MKMPTDRELAVGGGAIVILGIPAYMGGAGHGLGMFASYAVLAGAALTVADRFASHEFSEESILALLQHGLFRILSVVVVGGLIYALARIAF